MTEHRNGEPRAKAHLERTYDGGAVRESSPVTVAAGRAAYREEFQLDYGPDRDEPLDVTESGHEF